MELDYSDFSLILFGGLRKMIRGGKIVLRGEQGKILNELLCLAADDGVARRVCFDGCCLIYGHPVILELEEEPQTVNTYHGYVS